MSMTAVGSKDKDLRGLIKGSGSIIVSSLIVLFLQE